MRLFAGLLLALATTGLEQPSCAQTVPNYFPLQEGNRWDYRGMVNGHQAKISYHIAKIEDIDGIRLARLEGLLKDQIVGFEHLQITEKGLFRHRQDGVAVKPPFQLLRFPIKDGESWQTDLRIGGTDVKVGVVCRVEQEEVTVPAGKFKTISIKVTVESGPKKSTAKHWFAEGVGMVKQTIEAPGDAVFLELEKMDLKK